MKAFVTVLFLLPSILYSQNSDWVYRNPNPQTDFNAVEFFNSTTGLIAVANGTILKTTNGCMSFQTQNSPITKSIHSFYFVNSLTGFACGDTSAIIYTTNSGANWNVVSQALSIKPLRAITFSDGNNGFACGPSGLLMRSTNAGMNWILMPQFTQLNLNSVYFLNSSKGFLCADSGKIFITSNGGSNWSIQSPGTIYQNFMCMEFLDPLKGFMGAASLSSGSSTNFYRTTDGGISWQNVLIHAVINSWNDIEFVNSNTGYVCSNDGPILCTTNSGTNWQITGLPPNTNMKSISKTDSAAIICGTNGWLSKIYPSGTQQILGGTKKVFNSISFLNENTGVVVANYQIINTTNSGLNWNINMFGNYSWFEGYYSSLVETRSYPSGNMFVVLFSPLPQNFPMESIYRSTDGGLSWGYLYGSLGYLGGFDEVDGITYVSHTSAILKSSGSNFTQVYSVTGTMLGDLEFTTAMTGFVIHNNNGGSNGILKTTNAGLNWVFTQNPGNKYLNNIEFLSSGTGYATSDSGFVMKTTNFGVSWQNINTGLNQYNQEIKFFDENNGWLLNYFYDPVRRSRLYFTKNGGINFYPITSLGNFNVNGFTFVNVNTGYVCGDSGKVLKTTNGGLTFIAQNSGFVPGNFSLSQNYPNPFNPVTNISFDIPKSGFVKITVFDLLGREITNLINQQLQPGSYTVDWDASNYPSGVYFYKIEAGDFVDSKKMVLMK